MTVMNDLDRFHLFGDVIDRLPQLGSRAAYARQFIRDRLIEHTAIYHCLRRGPAGNTQLEMGSGRKAQRKIAGGEEACLSPLLRQADGTHHGMKLRPAGLGRQSPMEDGHH